MLGEWPATETRDRATETDRTCLSKSVVVAAHPPFRSWVPAHSQRPADRL